jgi:hypothetical protein
MSWRDASSDDAVFCQVRDDGAPLSMVMRYHEDAPTYAWVRVSAAKDGVIVLPLMPSASARARPIRQRVMRSSTNRHKCPNLRKPKLRAVTP